MKNKPIVPILLAGGVGNRLWPLSNKLSPKQFLHGTMLNKSFFQSAIQRALLISTAEKIITISNREFSSVLFKQFAEEDFAQKSNIILEPLSKNTAIAVAISCLYVLEKFGDAILLITPTDQIICKDKKFSNIVTQMSRNLPENYIGTFGVTTNEFNNNYGYLITDRIFSSSQKIDIYKVKSFVEKPSLEKINKIAGNDKYYINSGIFLASASTIFRIFNDLAPFLLMQAQKIYQNMNKKDDGCLYINENDYHQLDSVSFDIIIQQYQKILTTIIDVGWSDIGSWDSLWETCANKVTKTLTFANGHLELASPAIVHSNDSQFVLVRSNKGVTIGKLKTG